MDSDELSEPGAALALPSGEVFGASGEEHANSIAPECVSDGNGSEVEWNGDVEEDAPQSRPFDQESVSVVSERATVSGSNVSHPFTFLEGQAQIDDYNQVTVLHKIKRARTSLPPLPWEEEGVRLPRFLIGF